MTLFKDLGNSRSAQLPNHWSRQKLNAIFLCRFSLDKMKSQMQITDSKHTHMGWQLCFPFSFKNCMFLLVSVLLNQGLKVNLEKLH